ncbi:MAG: hypothetical protein IPM55_09335 [Acidobacteria bacterium]|nr:hypothetical protein [Acidobacteriota bacterium]
MILTVILVAVSVFYLSTFREGHDWGDDFAMYIKHSMNIVEGVPYNDTGFIPNPTHIIGPQTYPPLFPLLLSPIYYIWGLNLTAMKVFLALLTVSSLAFMFFAFRDHLPVEYRLALIAMIGFNPLFWIFKDNIVSDLPFSFFTFLSLCTIHTSIRNNPKWPGTIVSALLISLTIYMAYGTRSVGLVLIPCLIAYDLIKHKRPSLLGILAVVFTLTAIYLQNKSVHNDGGYGPQITIGTKHIVSHFWIYVKLLPCYLENGYSKIIKLGLYFCVSCLALIGYFTRLRKGITCFEIFPFLYIGPFLLLPILPIERYLAVVVPIYFCYALIGIRSLTAGRKAEVLAFSAFLIVIFGSYALKYTTMDFGPFREGVGTAESLEMFEYVKKSTSLDDTFLFRKPRALAAFTDRNASSWDSAMQDSEQWNYIEQIKATYLILGPEELEPVDYAYLQGFISRNAERFEKRFSNKNFSIYKILQNNQTNNHNLTTQ